MRTRFRFRRAIERRPYGWPRTQHASSRTSRSRERCSSFISTERGSPKYECAALRWLERYVTEAEPRLQHFAEVAGDLARLEA
jgi:hypothetical protein